MEGARTVESMKEFNPLFILRYSATHKQEHNKVYRLDALDAFNQKLVKKIGVRGISVKGQAGASAYLVPAVDRSFGGQAAAGSGGDGDPAGEWDRPEAAAAGER